jgi:hypothetical protein
MSVVASGKSFCAYEVKVLTASGRPFPRTTVGVIENDTQTGWALTDEAGVARLCDVPIHKVDIVVGAVNCGLVLLKGIRPTWPVTRKISVIRDTTDCTEWTFASACQVLVRVHDEAGKPVAGARFRYRDETNRPARLISDSIGRLFWKLRSGETLEGIVSAGPDSAVVSQTCVRGNEEDIETSVVLKR